MEINLEVVDDCFWGVQWCKCTGRCAAYVPISAVEDEESE